MCWLQADRSALRALIRALTGEDRERHPPPGQEARFGEGGGEGIIQPSCRPSGMAPEARRDGQRRVWKVFVRARDRQLVRWVAYRT
jgi:hypothetical protein